MDVIGYLQNIDGMDIKTALGRAVSAFRQREGRDPTWVEAGDGVRIPKGITGPLGGLQRVSDRGCRPGCILVGIDEVPPSRRSPIGTSPDRDEENGNAIDRGSVTLRGAAEEGDPSLLLHSDL